MAAQQARQPVRVMLGIARAKLAQHHLEIAPAEVAARQCLGMGPALLRRDPARELVHHLLGQLAVSGDLAAENGQERRALLIEQQHVVARDRRRVLLAVVV